MGLATTPHVYDVYRINAYLQARYLTSPFSKYIKLYMMMQCIVDTLYTVHNIKITTEEFLKTTV